MKRILPLLAVTCLALFTSCGQDNFLYSDCHGWQLPQGTKSCKMAIYNAFTEDGETVKGSPKEAVIFIFTDKGYIERGAFYDSEGKLREEITTETKDGYITKRMSESEYGGPTITIYTYDKKHHLVNSKTESDYHSSIENYTWEDGKIAKYVNRFTDNEEINHKHVYTFEYNDDGSYEIELRSDDDKLTGTFKYNEDHRVTYKKFNDESPAKVQYNEKGFPEVTQKCDLCGEMEGFAVGLDIAITWDGYESTYEYEYDDHGTWIKCTHYDENNQPVEIITREIEY